MNIQNVKTVSGQHGPALRWGLAVLGAVCAGVAKQMAEGARRVLGCDLAVSTTGVAGPDSDDRGNPVGLVYVALAAPEGTEVEELHLARAVEGRFWVRTMAANHALDLIRRWLEGHPA